MTAYLLVEYIKGSEPYNFYCDNKEELKKQIVKLEHNNAHYEVFEKIEIDVKKVIAFNNF